MSRNGPCDSFREENFVVHVAVDAFLAHAELLQVPRPPELPEQNSEGGAAADDHPMTRRPEILGNHREGHFGPEPWIEPLPQERGHGDNREQDRQPKEVRGLVGDLSDRLRQVRIDVVLVVRPLLKARSEQLGDRHGLVSIRPWT